MEARFELARALYRLHRLKEARRVLVAALEIDAEDAQLNFLLGRVCYEQGDKECGDRHSAISQQRRQEQ